MIHQDLVRALDPVAFSRYIGIKPDEWQADVLRYEGSGYCLTVPDKAVNPRPQPRKRYTPAYTARSL
jgi:hypothetical protein